MTQTVIRLIIKLLDEKLCIKQKLFLQKTLAISAKMKQHQSEKKTKSWLKDKDASNICNQMSSLMGGLQGGQKDPVEILNSRSTISQTHAKCR